MAPRPAPRDRGPLLSACMIVRDEQEALPRCLAALRGVVDEVVVLDTGSTDRTVEVARAAGATVVEGTWEDDFGAARNRALAACSGTWTLHVDADEELVAEPAALRALLRRADVPDALLVTIENLDAGGRVSMRHQACRLFRRGTARWEGRLHEQVVSTTGDPLPRALVPEVTILHHGYRADVFEARGKADRNLALARAALDDARAAGEGVARALLDLARAEAADGDLDAALERCAQARALDGPVAVHRWVLRYGGELSLALGRSEDAIAWAGALRAAGANADVADLIEGGALLQLGRAPEALEKLAPLGEVWDDAGVSVGTDLVAQRKAVAIAATGPETADRIIEDLYHRDGGAPRAVAMAVHVAPELELGRALEWSARIRRAGMAERCPLVARAGRADLDPGERLLAAAVAHGTFGDDRAVAEAEAVAPLLPSESLTDHLAALGELAPALVPAVVLAGLTDAGRTEAFAAALDALGAHEQAAVLRA